MVGRRRRGGCSGRGCRGRRAAGSRASARATLRRTGGVEAGRTRLGRAGAAAERARQRRATTTGENDDRDGQAGSMWRGLFRFSSSRPISAPSDHDVAAVLSELLAQGSQPIAVFVNDTGREVSVVVQAEHPGPDAGTLGLREVGGLRLTERLDHDDAPQSTLTPQQWRLAQRRSGLRSLRETDWSALAITGTRAFVTFSRGPREHLHDATAAFDERGRLRVTVIVGTPPDDDGGVVPAVAVIDRAVIELPFEVVGSR